MMQICFKINNIREKACTSPFFVSTGVALPRPAPRLHTWRTQPFSPFGWALFPSLPENRTQGHTCVHVQLVSSALSGVSGYLNLLSEQKSGVAITGLPLYVLIYYFVLVSFILSYHITFIFLNP